MSQMERILARMGQAIKKMPHQNRHNPPEICQQPAFPPTTNRGTHRSLEGETPPHRGDKPLWWPRHAPKGGFPGRTEAGLRYSVAVKARGTPRLYGAGSRAFWRGWVRRPRNRCIPPSIPLSGEMPVARISPPKNRESRPWSANHQQLTGKKVCQKLAKMEVIGRVNRPNQTGAVPPICRAILGNPVVDFIKTLKNQSTFPHYPAFLTSLIPLRFLTADQ